jgi:hypothetical protein
MIELSDAEGFSLAIGLHTTLFGVRGVIGPTLGTLLYASGVLPLNGIFWLIAGLLAFGSCMMFLFARRGAPRARKASGATGGPV